MNDLDASSRIHRHATPGNARVSRVLRGGSGPPLGVVEEGAMSHMEGGTPPARGLGIPLPRQALRDQRGVSRRHRPSECQFGNRSPIWTEASADLPAADRNEILRFAQFLCSRSDQMDEYKPCLGRSPRKHVPRSSDVRRGEKVQVLKNRRPATTLFKRTGQSVVQRKAVIELWWPEIASPSDVSNPRLPTVSAFLLMIISRPTRTPCC